MISTRMIGESHPSAEEKMPAGCLGLSVKDLLRTCHPPSNCNTTLLSMEIMFCLSEIKYMHGFEWYIYRVGYTSFWAYLGNHLSLLSCLNSICLSVLNSSILDKYQTKFFEIFRHCTLVLFQCDLSGVWIIQSAEKWKLQRLVIRTTNFSRWSQ